MARLQIDILLKLLAEERPVFHSEADFQHSLAWKIHQQYEDAYIRLEMPVSVASRPMHFDIVLRFGDEEIAIELKYKTRKILANCSGEEFNLRDHSATDTGGYDFLKDIWRIEQFVKEASGRSGFVILLTNEGHYWRGVKKADGSAIDFSLKHGRVIHGRLSWSEKTASFTQRGRGSFSLHNKYELSWKDFSKLDGPGGEFRYLLLAVGR